jgi:hypothetical protein
MTEKAAESIIDAYGWAIELSVQDLPNSAKVKLDGLCDTLRDYLIELLSGKEASE